MPKLMILKRFLLIALIIPQFIFAEDVYFKVIETTPSWLDINFPKPSNISGEISQGSVVKAHTGVKFSDLEGIYEGVPFQRIIYNDKNMLVFGNSLVPVETQDLFDKTLLNNSERPLVSSFFIDALRSLDREIIYLHDKTAWDEKMEYIRATSGDENDWGLYGSGNENLVITQTTLSLDSHINDWDNLLVKNIKKTSEGYIITVKEIIVYRGFKKWLNRPISEEQEFFNILLIPDGDYIDLYFEDKNTLIDTFVFTNSEVINQLNNLIWGQPRGGPTDLSKITWPRRADGSMDYPPPTNVLYYNPTHRATDSLRLRDAPDTASKTVTTMQNGTEVQVLETGVTATIEGITAPWVKVITSNGYIGWCFSGFLEEIIQPESVITSVNESQESELDESSKRESSLPLWALLAIGGGVVALAGGAMVVVVRRKK